jgi:hypothetical protein
MKFGLAYIRAVDLQPLNLSTFINQGQLKYDGVIVTPSDQLRLWPSIYLNDSLVNFEISTNVLQVNNWGFGYINQLHLQYVSIYFQSQET